MSELTWRWPGNKPIAVIFNVCLEAWSDGKAPGISPMGNPLPAGALDTMAISWAAYGVKRGIYRLLDALRRHNAKASVMTSAIIAERAPEAVKAVADAGHEVLSHSYTMDVIPALLSLDEQKRNIMRCTTLLERASGKSVKGWLSPRGTSGPELPQLLAQAGYTWYGDVFDDDLPYVQDFGGLKIVAIPLSTDVNDMPFMKYGNAPRTMLELVRGKSRSRPRGPCIRAHRRHRARAYFRPAARRLLFREDRRACGLAPRCLDRDPRGDRRLHAGEDCMTELVHYQAYIDGKFVDAKSGAVFGTEDPFSGEVWALVPRCDAADVDRAVEAAYKAFTTGPWPALTPTARGALLFRLADLIAENAQALADVEVRDNGKLLAEMSAQMRYLPQWYRYFGGLADKIEGSVIPIDKPDMFNFTRREPLGVIAAITPWNSPLLLMAWKIAPALAAGNTVVVKPSEYTSCSALEFAHLVEQAGFPPGVFNVVTGFGAEAGEPLATHPKVAKVAFTGGDVGGRRVYQAAAAQLKPVVLELGGKSPNIVFDDCVIDDAVKGAVSGIFAASGQTCIAGSRLLVQELDPRSVPRPPREVCLHREARQSASPDHAGRPDHHASAAQEGARLYRHRP